MNSKWRNLWNLPDDVTYLNHGSFGPSPLVVQQKREEYSRRLEREPMRFFMREADAELDYARAVLAEFVGCSANDLVFVDNATVGMNIIGNSIGLNAGDEILLTDHEYGAVARQWRQRCAEADARVVTVELPLPRTNKPMADREVIVSAIMGRVTERTKLIVVSHITSPTALILPVQEICEDAHSKGVPVCIDGPHAIAQIPVDLNKIACDFYTASCHKWLCAPFGTGFLYVAPKHQSAIEPVVISWGGRLSGKQNDWKEEYSWVGTRDPAGFLSVPAAISFLQDQGLEKYRQHGHRLVKQARVQICELTGLEPISPDDQNGYSTMVSVPLPMENWKPPKPSHRDPLQDRLWEEHKIEIPVINWKNQRFMRVSCHLYNSENDISILLSALGKQLKAETG